MPKIYVVSLSDYNAGTLHAEWIDLDGKDAEDVTAEITAMLEASPSYLTCENCAKRIKFTTIDDSQGKLVKIFHHDVVETDGSNNHTVCNWGTDEMVGSIVASPGAAEEWAIHDSEGFGSITIDEHEDLTVLCDMAALITEHGDAAIAWLSDNASEHVDNLENAFNEAYLGDYDSAADYAYSYVEDTGMLAEVSGYIAQYFDYEAFGRDMVLGGDINIIDGHVFNGNV